MIREIHTAGYQGLTLDEFTNKLAGAGIRTLIDVRKTPFSRIKGFSRTSLKTQMNNAGIDYIHMPELGVESSWRNNLNTPEDHKALLERYKAEVLSNRKTELRTITELLESGQTIVLVCMEKDPAACHRTMVAQAVSELTGAEVVHL
jgi:uncharacterized protein (DUF488 family)